MNSSPFRVEEAYREDVGKNVGRIPFKEMYSIGASVNDLLVVKGVESAKKTIVTCMPCLKGEEGRFIKLDTLSRSRLRTITLQNVYLSVITDNDMARLGEDIC